MRLEDQVCSLELAKRLKELGVKQESAFYWNYYDSPAGGELVQFEDVPPVEKQEGYSAFTVAELGEMFPNVGCLCETHRLLDEWVCCYSTERSEGFLQVEQSLYADTEANARAKMLIYLIEHGIIKAEGIL